MARLQLSFGRTFFSLVISWFIMDALPSTPVKPPGIGLVAAGAVQVSSESELRDALLSYNKILLRSDIIISSTVPIIGLTNLSINGNGYSIDGKALYRCFHVESSTSTLSNLHVVNCKVNGDGGGFSIFTSSVGLKNVNISDCIARGSSGLGAGVFAQNSNLSFSRCHFSRNTATSGGGAVYFTGAASSLLLTRCTMSSNTASALLSFGGGLSVQADTDALIKDCTFQFNEAGFGGAAYFFDSNIPLIEGCLFSRNMARSSGGALMFDSASETLQINVASIAACEFTGNSAMKEDSFDGGGALCITGATLENLIHITLVNCVLNSNYAAGKGGAIFVYSNLGTLVDLVGSLFSNNSAVYEVSSADVATDNSEALSVYSLCQENEYNFGSGILQCNGCTSNFPADLSSSVNCRDCPLDSYSCCGATECVSSIPSCSTTEKNICTNVSAQPSQTPSFNPTAPTEQPSTAPTPIPSIIPTAPTPGPSSAPTAVPSDSPTAPTAGPSLAPISIIPASSASSWFYPNYFEIMILGATGAAGVFGVTIVAFKFRLRRWPSSNSAATMMLTAWSSSIELSFCSYIKFCDRGPQCNGLVLLGVSVALCGLVLLNHLRRVRLLLDTQTSLFPYIPVLMLSTLDGNAVIWLPWRETAKVSALHGFPDKRLSHYPNFTMFFCKVPILILMIVYSKKQWRNYVCVLFTTLSMISIYFLKRTSPTDDMDRGSKPSFGSEGKSQPFDYLNGRVQDDNLSLAAPLIDEHMFEGAPDSARNVAEVSGESEHGELKQKLVLAVLVGSSEQVIEEYSFNGEDGVLEELDSVGKSFYDYGDSPSENIYGDAASTETSTNWKNLAFMPNARSTF